MLVGLPNRIINQMCAELMANQDFAKFVYYKNETGDILSLPDLENPHKLLKNNQVHINRKIPKILHDFDVNVFLNLGRWQSYKSFNGRGHASQKIDDVTIKIVVLMQSTCLQTENGNRDIALVSIIKDILESSDLGGIGQCSIDDVAELYALPAEYHGFELYCKVSGFKKLKVEV